MLSLPAHLFNVVGTRLLVIGRKQHLMLGIAVAPLSSTAFWTPSAMPLLGPVGIVVSTVVLRWIDGRGLSLAAAHRRPGRQSARTRPATDLDRSRHLRGRPTARPGGRGRWTRLGDRRCQPARFVGSAVTGAVRSGWAVTGAVPLDWAVTGAVRLGSAVTGWAVTGAVRLGSAVTGPAAWDGLPACPIRLGPSSWAGPLGTAPEAGDPDAANVAPAAGPCGRLRRSQAGSRGSRDAGRTG